MLREYGYTPNKKYHALPRSLTEGYICVLLRVWVRRSTPRLVSEIRSAWISFPVMSLLSVDLEHSHRSMTICGLGSVICWAFKNVLYPVSVLVLTSYWTWVQLWSPQHGLEWACYFTNDCLVLMFTLPWSLVLTEMIPRILAKDGV